jgi:acyl-coenzyme A thioesterase 13
MQGWGGTFSKDGLKLVGASSSPAGKTVFEFRVNSTHTNGMGNLHGGCTATLFDWCTTTALIPISDETFWRMKGVSRTLNVTYLRPVPEGTVVLIESEVVHAGKKLCMFLRWSTPRSGITNYSSPSYN